MLGHALGRPARSASTMHLRPSANFRAGMSERCTPHVNVKIRPPGIEPGTIWLPQVFTVRCSTNWAIAGLRKPLDWCFHAPHAQLNFRQCFIFKFWIFKFSSEFLNFGTPSPPPEFKNSIENLNFEICEFLNFWIFKFFRRNFQFWPPNPQIREFLNS